MDILLASYQRLDQARKAEVEHFDFYPPNVLDSEHILRKAHKSLPNGVQILEIGPVVVCLLGF